MAAEFDLEARRKSDGSWHPCSISLSDDNLDILIQFEGTNDKDIVSDEKDALERLRYRSVPLGKGECSDIGEGDCVLVVNGAQCGSLLFDAVVTETRRVKHSKRANCKCLFQIKWLNPEMEESVSSVSSSSIRKLSKKSITSHLVLDAFLNSLNPATSVNGSPPHSLLDDTIWGLLEKIEGMSTCTDKSTEWAGDNFLNAKRGKHSGDALNTATKGPNNTRRSTRTQTKQVVEKEVDEHSEDKPFVSPLAACAALASYIHELSPNHGILFSLEKEDHAKPSSKVDTKHNQEHHLDVPSMLLKSDSGTSAVSNPPSQSTSHSPVNAKCSRSSPYDVRSPGKYSSNDTQVSSSRSQKSNLSKGRLRSTPMTDHMTIPLLVTDGELKCRTSRRRVNRSAVQEQLIDSIAEVQEFPNDIQDSQKNTGRRTRSAKHRDTSNPRMSEVAMSMPAESSQVQESEDNPSRETAMECVRNAVTDVKLDQPRTRRSSVREKTDLTFEVAQESSNKKHNDPVSTTKLTRSLKRKEASERIVQQEVGKIKLTKTLLDTSVEDIATQEKREESKKKSTPSLVDAGNVSTIQLKRSYRMSSTTISSEEDQSEVIQKAEHSTAVKKKAVSSKKFETRSSARLNSLPRTC